MSKTLNGSYHPFAWFTSSRHPILAHVILIGPRKVVAQSLFIWYGYIQPHFLVLASMAPYFNHAER